MNYSEGGNHNPRVSSSQTSSGSSNVHQWMKQNQPQWSAMYATLNQKPIPPAKPPRRHPSTLERSLSQEHYHQYPQQQSTQHDPPEHQHSVPSWIVNANAVYAYPLKKSEREAKHASVSSDRMWVNDINPSVADRKSISSGQRGSEKPVPPPKPPRLSINGGMGSMAPHISKSQHHLNWTKSVDFGYSLPPEPPEGYGSLKRSASNDRNDHYAEIGSNSNSSHNSRGPNATFSTFLGSRNSSSGISSSSPSQPQQYHYSSPHYEHQLHHPQPQHTSSHQQQSTHQQMTEKSNYEKLIPQSSLSVFYDEIAKVSSAASVASPSTSLSSSHVISTPPSDYSNPILTSSGVSSFSQPGIRQRDKKHSVHSRSKSEHHPRCPNFLHMTHEPPSRFSLTSTSSDAESTHNFYEAPPEPRRRASIDQVIPSNPPPAPDMAMKKIRSVIKPLHQEYKEWKKLRPKSMETFVEEKFFASIDSNGKKISIRYRHPDSCFFQNKALVTDPVPDDFFAPLESQASGTCLRTSKTIIEDGKRSLRRTKHQPMSTHYGTAERRKKKLSTAKSLDAKSSSSESTQPQSVDVSKPEVSVTQPTDPPPETEATTSGDQLLPPSISPFDGNEMWAEIEGIIASFASDLGREGSPDTGPSDPHTTRHQTTPANQTSKDNKKNGPTPNGSQLNSESF